MEKTLAYFLGIAALIFQGVGYLGFLNSVYDDALYLLIALFIGFAFSLWFLVSSWTSANMVESNIRDADGNKVLVSQRPGWVRKTLACAVFVFAIGGCIYGWWYLGETALYLAEVGEPFIISTTVMVSEGNQRKYPAALCASSKVFGGLTADSLMGDTIGVRFSLIKRPRISWIEVDAINVKVEKIEPLPKFLSERYYGATLTNTYLAVIDKPAADAPFVVRAKYIDMEGGKDALRESQNVIYLTDYKPQPFNLRISAKTPGIYTYSVEINVHYRWQKQEPPLVVCQGMQCAFLPRESEPEAAKPAMPAGEKVPGPKKLPLDEFKVPVPK
jgi:hypothetical protein